MGFSRRRPGRDGKPRYTAYYLDIRDRERSAGTFARKKEADDAWKNAEAAIRAGRRGDPSRGKRLFESYVLDDWLPHHQLEPGVRSEYARQIRKHLVPFFGPMKMRDIMPEQVRQWVTAMQAKGARPRTIQYCKVSILNAIFTTALADEVVTIHPSRGVKTPPVPKNPRRIITAAEFDLLYTALPDADARLLMETDIESGLRWGELTELRPRDLDVPTRILTVSRATVEVPCEEHPSGGRFLVKDYPKDKEYRRLKLSAQITAKLVAHIRARRLGPDDLLFSYRAPDGPASRRSLAIVRPPGLTDPDANGRRYRHGTLTAYNAAKCRCEHCRGAYATYRAVRRSAGKDSPRTRRTRETDGHIPADWFRRQVWYPARDAAGLAGLRIHDLRHAHASWLLAGGADLQVVKERLGHASIVTTERYLHKPSGIALAGRSTRSLPDYQGPHAAPTAQCRSFVTWGYARTSPSDARLAPQAGKIIQAKGSPRVMAARKRPARARGGNLPVWRPDGP